MSFFRRKKQFIFPEEETRKLVSAIKEAELKTSGEIRVYVERRCKYVDAIDRASQIFSALKMEETKLRNGVLFYVATTDRQIAIYADSGIHDATGKEYWNDVLKRAISAIRHENLIAGLAQSILEAGTALQQHFPYDKDTDKNELPDDIVFGD